MRLYELMVVLTPDIPDDQMPTALERVSGYITVGGGEITEMNTTAYNSLTLGRRRLAYPIDKHRDGYYALYHFNLDPLGIVEIERELHLNNQVLRHLITSYVPTKVRPPKKPKAGAAAATMPDGETADTAAAPVVTMAEAMTPDSMEREGASVATAPVTAVTAQEERAPVTSASGASMDVDTPVPPGPDGEDNDEPPTAETPDVDE